MRTRQPAVVAGALAIGLTFACSASAQEADPRIGTWENQDNPDNIMTYAPIAGGGMSVLVEDLSDGSSWGYSSNLDGTFGPMHGSTSRDEAAVTIIDQFVNEIRYRTDGEVSSLLTNVISEDGNTLWVTFRDPEGVQTAVATYRKVN